MGIHTVSEQFSIARRHCRPPSSTTNVGLYVYLRNEDGYSGEDFFTYKVIDGIDEFTAQGISTG